MSRDGVPPTPRLKGAASLGSLALLGRRADARPYYLGPRDAQAMLFPRDSIPIVECESVGEIEATRYRFAGVAGAPR